jgi:hypothetical protein
MTPSLRVLSLGAGVQSSTLYLMAVAGEFGYERPDLAVFADTQWEPRLVYDWLNFLESEHSSAIPIVRTSAGNIRDAALTTRLNPESGRTSRVVSLPLYTINPDGSRGTLHRQCTRDFKIRPIRRAVHRALATRGLTWRNAIVEQWVGISTDEASRMKDSGVAFIHNRFPLIERNLSRNDCLRWLAAHGLDVSRIPKSACIACPYTDSARWRSIKSRPDEWANAVDFDRSIRRLAEVSGECFVHSSLTPLESIDFDAVDDDENQDLFENECEGLCGV